MILFILSALVLHHQSEQNKRRSSGSFGTRVYLTLGYVLFALITTGWIFHWIMFLHPNLATGGDQTADWTSTFLFLQGIVDDVAIFVADLILIYRLYIVWNRSKTILCLGGAPIVAYVVLFIPYIVIPAKTKHYWEAGVAIMSFLNLGTNIVVTILISYRIWTTSRLTRALGDGKVIIKVIAIVVESAALQTMWMVTYSILHVLRSDASYMVLYSLPPISGITSSLVNVRVGLGWATGEEGRSVHTLTHSSLSESEFQRHESFME